MSEAPMSGWRSFLVALALGPRTAVIRDATDLALTEMTAINQTTKTAGYTSGLLSERVARMAADRPDRAAAVREVEALLRRVHDVTEEADDVVRVYLAGDGALLRDVHNMTAAELASLVVDAVLGQEET